MLLSLRSVKERTTIRISELARTTEVPVATIKYYIREGLLPPGVATGPNQASYSDLHVHRLRLVRVLREIGDLSIDAIRGVVRAVEDPSLTRHEVLGVAHRAVSPVDPGEHLPELAEVDELLRQLGWEVSPTAPDRHELAQALASLRALGRQVDATTFLPHAHAVDELAAHEIATTPADASATEAVERVIVGTVVYGKALTALRRLAHEHHSARRHLPEPS